MDIEQEYSEKEKGLHRRKVVLKNTFFTLVAYFIPSSSLILSKTLDLISLNWFWILLFFLWPICSTSALFLICLLHKSLTKTRLRIFTFLEYSNWIIVYSYIMLVADEARESLLLFSLLGGLFLFTFASFSISLLYSTLSVLFYFAGSYFGAKYLGQPSHLKMVALFSLSYIPLTLFNSWLMYHFRKQGKELVEAKKNAALKPILEEKLQLALELEKAHLEFSRKLLEAQEKERNWIAREIHDDFGQELSLLKIQTFSISDTTMQETIQRLILKTRSLSKSLISIDLKQAGFESSCLGLIEAFQKSFAITHNIELSSSKSLSEEQQLHIYRILQECLHNSLKHSQASAISIDLYSTDTKINFSYKDNGIGFSLYQTAQGVGLTSIHERSKLLSAQVEIKSSEHNGFSLSLSF